MSNGLLTFEFTSLYSGWAVPDCDPWLSSGYQVVPVISQEDSILFGGGDLFCVFPFRGSIDVRAAAENRTKRVNREANGGYCAAMLTAGIDIGSITTKAALLRNGSIAATLIIATGYNTRQAGRRIYERLLAECSLCKEDISRVVSTGYGRNSVDFADRAVTEITCHGAGAHYQERSVRSVIDIGGQDCKAMVLNHDGKVIEFVMNDKCAAGTGRFLEVMARALEVDLDSFGEMSLESVRAAAISSLCTVFAESEVISLIAKGECRNNIIRGIHESIGVRIGAMARRIGITAPVMMTGGVSRNVGVVRAIENQLGMEVIVPVHAQANGAVGAALIAAAMA